MLIVKIIIIYLKNKYNLFCIDFEKNLKVKERIKLLIELDKYINILCTLLNIDNKNFSFFGKLSISFQKEVFSKDGEFVNATYIHSTNYRLTQHIILKNDIVEIRHLIHEWFHYLDYSLCLLEDDINVNQSLSYITYANLDHKTHMTNIINQLISNNNELEYFQRCTNVCKLLKDNYFNKVDEMVARAFEVYIEKRIKDKYDTNIILVEEKYKYISYMNKKICIYPTKIEMEYLT